mmetsp:Transcript_13336/g.36781  ORF Transcript_13336/g.36781 Transcript_13336/m.36781 type:complete len:394 (-) Transcript_13336:413-1594(-)
MSSLWLIQFVQVVGVLTAAVSAQNANELKLQQVEWLRSCGGYFNEKLSFDQPPGSDEPTGGIFTTEDIAKGETVLAVPTSCQLRERNECLTAIRLAEEYVGGETESDFWPYIKYVFEVYPHDTLPDAWTAAGKGLMEAIVGPELDPYGFGDGSFHRRCSSYEERIDYDETSEDLLEAAMRIVNARGWNNVMLPVYDMVNHNNGPMRNVGQVHDSKKDPNIVVHARRNIKKGEEISNSYNECNDHTCYGIAHTYVTPDIFKDYGFIEQYRALQRWRFYTTLIGTKEALEESILFDIQSRSSTSVPKEPTLDDLELKWLSDKPTADQVMWLKMQIGRLKGMQEYVEYTAGRLEQQFEADAALRYYEALLTALEMALKWSDGTPPLTNPNCPASEA